MKITRQVHVGINFSTGTIVYEIRFDGSNQVIFNCVSLPWADWLHDKINHEISEKGHIEVDL